MSRVFSWILNLVYLGAIVVCSPLVLWAMLRTGKYREGYAQKLLGLVPRRERQGVCVWIHAVSVGEVSLVATLLSKLRAAHPDWQFVISTTSKAGYDLARKKYAELTVFYCPLDFSWAVQRAMRRVRPTLLLLAELELWPNLIMAAKEQGAGVAIVNGRMSDHSFPGYRRVRPLVSRVLRQIDLIAVQNDESAGRFRALGAPAERVHVTGSLKYDGAETNRHNPRTNGLRKLTGFSNDVVVFLAGSTQEPEEQIAIEIYQRLRTEHPQLRLVLVPRHPERFDDVAQQLDASGLPWIRRTQLDDSRGPTAQRPILLVDTIGELAAWWGTAKIAFVGGSFGSRGGQNMIEPAAYGAAVAFGPNTRNFRDIVGAMLAAEAAVVVNDGPQLESFVRRCLEEPAYPDQLGDRAQQLVAAQLGATSRTAALIDSLLRSVAVDAIRTAAA